MSVLTVKLGWLERIIIGYLSFNIGIALATSVLVGFLFFVSWINLGGTDFLVIPFIAAFMTAPAFAIYWTYRYLKQLYVKRVKKYSNQQIS